MKTAFLIAIMALMAGLCFAAQTQPQAEQDEAWTTEKENLFVASLDAKIDKHRKQDVEMVVVAQDGPHIAPVDCHLGQSRDHIQFGYDTRSG